VPRRSGFPRGRTIPPRRANSWDFGPGQAGAQSQITGSVTTLASASLSVLVDGLTLARLRGMFHSYLSAAAAPQDGFVGAFGIAVATTAAIAVGATAVPSPITEQDWDGWLYWTPVFLVSPGVIDGTVSDDRSSISGQTGSQIQVVDSKAMRKLNEAESIYGALEVSEVGTATMNWHFDSRILLKLP